MNALLNKKSVVDTDGDEGQAFRAALRALRPPIQPSDALDMRVRALAQKAQQRMEKRQRVRRVASLATGLCALTVCAVNSPRLWAEYQLFQVARRVASAPSVRTVIVRNSSSRTVRRELSTSGQIRQALTISGDDAVMQSASLSLTRREGEINYWGDGSSPANISSLTGSQLREVLTRVGAEPIVTSSSSDDEMHAACEQAMTHFLALDFLSSLRQASLPLPLSRTAYRLARWTTAGGKIDSALLENGDGHLLTISLDGTTGLPSRVVEQSPPSSQWSQVSQTITYPSALPEDWVSQVWRQDRKRLWRARRLSVQSLLIGPGNMRLSSFHKMFRYGDDIFLFYTNNPVVDRIPKERMAWEFIVNGTSLALVHRFDTRFLLPDETGKDAPLLIDGQPLRVLWFTPLSPLHLDDRKVCHFSLNNYLPSHENLAPRLVSRLYGSNLFERIPYQIGQVSWPQSLLGSATDISSRQTYITVLRNVARREYLSSPLRSQVKMP